MPQSVANSTKGWEIIDVSNLSNIDQFEMRNLTFALRISDAKVLEKLKEPGFYIGGGASLTLNDQTEFFGSSKSAFLSYPCFSVKPPAFGAENAYSALRGTETRYSTHSDFKYNCWFPAGMRQGNYTLTIYQNLALNNGWSSLDSWANFQMFVFGQNESSLSKSYSEILKSLIDDGRAVVQGKLPIGEITVLRKQKYGPQSDLILNQKVIQENIKNLESEAEKYQEYLQNQKKKISDLNSLNTSNTKLLSKIQVKNLSSVQKNQVLVFRTENKNIWEKIQKLSSPLIQEPQNVEQDPYQRFLNAINFDLSARPEVIYAEYPDVSTINSKSTPYLKFIIKSKAQIYRISAMISPIKEGTPLHFTGNVIFPGQLPVNNQLGGGLALIENQAILDGFIYTTALVSPMYTPISSEELIGARASTHTMATITDIAGNSSIQWNRQDGVDGLIPKPTRPEFLNNYFDVLKNDYQNLYMARQNFLKIPNYQNQSEGILEELANLERESLSLKGKISKLSKAGKKG